MSGIIFEKDARMLAWADLQPGEVGETEGGSYFLKTERGDLVRLSIGPECRNTLKGYRHALGQVISPSVFEEQDTKLVRKVTLRVRVEECK